MAKEADCVARLCEAGFSYQDATALRRIAMTLHRWHEMECGDSNDHASWCIVRGYNNGVDPFTYDDDGLPFIENHSHFGPKDVTTYLPINDREKGAHKRLQRIMARYPGFVSYVQGDPRGAALYVIQADRVNGQDVSSCYTRGIAVYK